MSLTMGNERMNTSASRHKLFGRWASAWLFCLACVAFRGQAQNLITNGSFESGTAPDGGFYTLGAGNTYMTGWTIVSGSIDLGRNWTAAKDLQSIDLDGNNAGKIKQTFNTTPGLQYKLLYSIEGNPGVAQTVSM